MAKLKFIAGVIPLLLGFMLAVPGCVVEPRDGFYDRGQHRWWHEHAWHDCGDREEHCRGRE